MHDVHPAVCVGGASPGHPPPLLDPPLEPLLELAPLLLPVPPLLVPPLLDPPLLPPAVVPPHVPPRGTHAFTWLPLDVLSVVHASSLAQLEAVAHVLAQ